MARCCRGAGLALLLSVSAHALLALACCFVPGPVSRASFDARVEDPGRELSLALAEPPLPARVAGGEEEQHGEADFAVSVRDAAASPGEAAEPGPVVVGLPPGPAAGGTGKAGPGVAGGRRSVLAVPTGTRSVVYVLDRSLSMGPSGALGRARREVLAALAELPDGAFFQLIVYNQQAVPLRGDGRSEYLPADAATREAVARELDGVAAAGRTDHVRALGVGLRLRPDVLFLLTDADDLTEPEVREVTRRNGGRTTIHAVELSSRRGEAGPLYRLATLNGGTYRRVPPAE